MGDRRLSERERVQAAKVVRMSQLALNVRKFLPILAIVTRTRSASAPDPMRAKLRQARSLRSRCLSATERQRAF